MVKLFSIFSRVTIIFVQASLIRFFFFNYSIIYTIQKQCLIFISSFSVFFLFIITFVSFKLFQLPLWLFLPLTEGYQQFCPRLYIPRATTMACPRWSISH